MMALCSILVGGTACGKDSSATKPDAKRAANALAAGLDAQSKGNLDEAVNQYNEALKYDHTNKYALYDLALIDAAHSNYGDAESKYRVVLGIDPAFEPGLFNLAILEKAKGNDEQAISLYQRAIAVAPKDASAHLNLGLLLRAGGQASKGNAEVAKAVALNPKLRDPAGSAAATPKLPVTSATPSSVVSATTSP